MALRTRGFYRIGMDGTVTAVAEPRRRVTYDDVVAAPADKVAEILDGELFLSPRPATRHALASSSLGIAIGGAFSREAGHPAQPGGWWILFEPELHFGSDVVVPDVAGWRRERMPCIPDEPWFELAPDWICETLSPATARIDRTRKLAVYARARVRHVWLLDPSARMLEVLALEEDRWLITESHGGSDIIRAAPFAAIELELARLWVD